MPTSSLKPLDPDMRQQLAAMLSGDAKAGSVRADLVRGLLGSQTGDDAGLVGMTPLGAAFDVSAANRDQRQGGTGAGHMLSAAAGMIPGAGPEAHALEPEAVAAIKHLVENFRPKDIAGDIVGKAYQDDTLHHLANKLGFNPEEGERNPAALTDALVQDYTPTDLATMHHDMQAHLGPDAIATPLHLADIADHPNSSGIRAQLEAAGKNDDKGATVVNAKTPPSVAGVDTSISKATKPQKVTVPSTPTVKGSRDPADLGRQAAIDHQIGTLKDRAANMPYSAEANGIDNPLVDHIAEVAGGDLKKLNFIKNAMQDEGGNVPEDVAMTLLQHMAEKKPDAFNALHDSVDPRGKDPDLALEHLINNHSIPEMLAMHYDLDPQTMGKTYAMPNKSRPTQ